MPGFPLSHRSSAVTLNSKLWALSRLKSPFFSSISLFRNTRFGWVLGNFLKRIPEANGEATT